MKFQFEFKFFPENVADEVIQDSTLKLLYLQVIRTKFFSVLNFVKVYNTQEGNSRSHAAFMYLFVVQKRHYIRSNILRTRKMRHISILCSPDKIFGL